MRTRPPILRPSGPTGKADHLQVALNTSATAPVFPCLPNKRPATRHGFKEATTDRERIRRWWTKHPDHLVGIPTQGLLVVDLDVPRRGDARPPDAAWRAWLSLARPNGWNSKDAVMVSTPSGGLHLYHTQPKGVTVRNSAGKLAPLIDIRADGGYVIAPGSRLPDGRSYELLTDPRTVPTAPSWLVDACTATPAPVAVPHRPPTELGGTRYGVQALQSELGRLATAVQGTRNDMLNRAAFRAGQLVAGDQLDSDYADNQLLTVALRIGLPEAEATATIRSGLSAGTQHPRGPRPQRPSSPARSVAASAPEARLDALHHQNLPSAPSPWL